MTVDTFPQEVLPGHNSTIRWRRFSRRHASTAVDALAVRLGDKEAYIGLALKLSSSATVELLALATTQEVFIISLDGEKGLIAKDKSFEDLLCGDFRLYTLVGFTMGQLALHGARHLKLPIRGIDLSTVSGGTWDPPSSSYIVKEKVFTGVDMHSVDALWMGDQGHRELCLRAWLSALVAEKLTMELKSAKRVDTSILTTQEIFCVSESIRQTCILDNAKPKDIQSEFTQFQVKDGTLELQNARYKTRVRGGNQTIIMRNELDEEFYGKARGARGRTTNIHFTGKALSGTLQQVRVFGPPQLTNHEKARDEFILLLLQGKASLRGPFMRSIWFPNEEAPPTKSSHTSSVEVPRLNSSQEAVVNKMMSDCPLVISHGPPGTGKTTTIAAAVSVWEKKKLPTWIIAHSNVAVKNLAETLFKQGVSFRILVSKEFHFEWHEHIYNEIRERVLVSDEILGVKDMLELSRILGPTTVMLSTLSMLSNPNVGGVGLFRLVPVGRLVVDEASQIKIDDFMHVLYKFRTSLKKLCFFGDPQQLPPHGRDQVPEIKTIFDFPHLKPKEEFLNTQYRMPVPLGDFISTEIYHGRLKSEHTIKNSSCVRFVDVPRGTEAKSGFSWTNLEEIKSILNIVKSYYRHQNFCVITPYDAQRSAIERQLKYESLPWEHVFNVDSFQGNEADFVIVSVVRSGHASGFLSAMNRMNVLLTRCRKGLVIVSNRSFIRDGGGRNTLLGSLERHWLERGSLTWVDWKGIEDGIVDLPGAPGPNRENIRVRPPQSVSIQLTTTPVGTSNVRHAPAFPVSPSVQAPCISSKSPPGIPYLASREAPMPLSGLRRAWVQMTPHVRLHSAAAGAVSTGYNVEFPPLAMAAVDFTSVRKSSKSPSPFPKSSAVSLSCTPNSQSDVKPTPEKIGVSTQVAHQPTNQPVVIRLQLSAQQIARARPERLSSNIDKEEAKVEKPALRPKRKGRKA